jgi:hypothetical protein
MGLLDDLTPPDKKRICLLGRIAETLSKEDQTKLAEALENDKWSSNALAKALTERGIKIQRHALHDHRTKACSCWRT